MTAHHLLAADMRRLPSPWNDLTWERKSALEELAPTEATERAALEALTAALSGPSASPVPRVWSDESWELFDRIRNEAGYRLAHVMPTADRFTREGIADVLREWAGTAQPPVPAWWLEDQLDLIVGVLTDQALAGWAHDVLRWLQRKPYDEAGVAAAAERCVESGLAAHDAVNLLHVLGAPHGEQALLRVVQDDSASESSRSQARDALLSLRRPGYDARAQRPAQGEHALLPPAVRELPYSWGSRLPMAGGTAGERREHHPRTGDSPGLRSARARARTGPRPLLARPRGRGTARLARSPPGHAGVDAVCTPGHRGEDDRGDA